MDSLEKRLTEAIEGQSNILLKQILDLEGKMKKEIDDLKKEVKMSSEKVEQVELKAKKLEREVKGKKNKM